MGQPGDGDPQPSRWARTRHILGTSLIRLVAAVVLVAGITKLLDVDPVDHRYS